MRLLCLLSNMLGPEEREAVLGDLTEAGASSRTALLAVLGLVARRQAGLWRDWRPWVILLGFVIPAGVALYVAARWDTGLIGSRTLREDLPWFTMLLLRSFATLACWSVMAGAVLRKLSPRALIVQGPALLLVMLLAQSLNLMTLLSSARYPSPHDPTDAWMYEAILPWLVQLVFVPTFLVWGMFLRLTRIALFGVAVTAILLLCRPLLHLQLSTFLPAPVMPCVVFWPIAYFAFRIVRPRVQVPGARTDSRR